MAAKSICQIDGCDKPVTARGFCRAHYTKFIRYGDPLALRKSGSSQRFIEASVLSFTGDECLDWPFAINAKSYGTFKNTLAHRYVCERAHGKPINNTDEAAHYCGNRKCVNPRHIRWASHAENMADCVIHGTTNRGERAASAKLTEHDVRQIRSIYDSMTNREIAKKFGISKGHVAQIANRKKWSHVV